MGLLGHFWDDHYGLEEDYSKDPFLPFRKNHQQAEDSDKLDTNSSMAGSLKCWASYFPELYL